jgi:hypothetical protein
VKCNNCEKAATMAVPMPGRPALRYCATCGTQALNYATLLGVQLEAKPIGEVDEALEWRPRLAIDEDLDTLVQRGDEQPERLETEP